jgi:hypothetical protein
MLGAGPFGFFPTKLSKSMLMLPASLAHVEPMGICFLGGSAGAELLFVELLKDVLDGRRMLSAGSDEKFEGFFS